MTRVSFGVEMQDHTARLRAAINASGLGGEDLAQMVAEWNALLDAGAELYEMRAVEGAIQIFPSEEFTAHCAKWGIHP